MKKNVKPKENNTKSKKGKTTKNNKKSKIWKKIAIAIVIIIIVLAGICAGLIFGLMSKYAITKDDLIIDYSNSIVVDSDEKQLAVLSAKENRKILTKKEMGEYLPNAFVSIEDKRFYSHHGVDIKRTGGALFTFLFHSGESSFGGSTITQQLVKNITNEKDDKGVKGAVRKVKEMVRAYQVENILSKDQILELYMNIIFLGGNVYGVGMASQYYFSKDATDLSLAESAFIAGITHSPNYYNPFIDNPKTDHIKSRTTTVLEEMKKQGRITDEDYNKAVAEVEKGLNFKQGTIIDKASYSSHTEALIKQAINQLVNEKGMDREYAETYLYSSGLKIYSTEISSIQSAIESEYAKTKYQVTTTVTKKVDGKDKKVKEKAQSAMVIIDHSNGYVVGAVGVLGEKGAGELNRVNQVRRQPGSSIKPIGVYGPALEEGTITISSVYEDKPLNFGGWQPKNSYSGYKGLLNMRQAMKISCNTVAVQVLKDVTPTKSLQYLKKLGITSLDEEKDNNLPLALGGVSDGISPLQMAGAYAAIANNGEYITPTFYTKIEDRNGNTIIEAKQPKEKVFSEKTTYLLKELLTEPTKSGGTASGCKISNMDTAAKTGTTNDVKDKWLCGFTPYYTAATWYGYDTATTIPSGARSNANTIWKNVMANIHKKLSKKTFERPGNLVTANVCKDSGLLATDLCKHDQRGSRVYTEYFVKGTVPTKTCNVHVEAEVCKSSNKLAGEFCPEVEKKVFITRESDTSSKNSTDKKYILPDDKCDLHNEDTSVPAITLNGVNPMSIKVGEKYIEPGAKATDTTDGDLTSKIIITGTVNNVVAGTYTITYTVSDSSGNVATATRTVNVVATTPPAQQGNNTKDENTVNSNTANNNTSQ